MHDSTNGQLTVIREDRDDVAVLLLSRPGRHNAFGPDMASLLIRELGKAVEDDSR